VCVSGNPKGVVGYCCHGQECSGPSVVFTLAMSCSPLRSFLLDNPLVFLRAIFPYFPSPIHSLPLPPPLPHRGFPSLLLTLCRHPFILYPTRHPRHTLDTTVHGVPVDKHPQPRPLHLGRDAQHAATTTLPDSSWRKQHVKSARKHLPSSA